NAGRPHGARRIAAMSDRLLQRLARIAGLLPQWRDAEGRQRSVAPNALRALLAALGIEASNPAAQRDAARALLAERRARTPALVTAEVGRPIALRPRADATRWKLVLEDGTSREGDVVRARGCVVLPPIDVTGYHTLELDSARIIVAVAPRRAPSPAEGARQ